MSEYVSLLDKFKAQMRVRIAKDVLSTMRFMTIGRGNFVKLTTDFILPEDSKKAAKKLQKSKFCNVCALGACFISLVGIDNKFSSDWDDLSGAPAGSTIQDRLSEYFDKEQIVLIENAFEQGTGYFTESNDQLVCGEVDTADAVAFGEKFYDDAKRLAAIMKNIVKNNGTFKP